MKKWSPFQFKQFVINQDKCAMKVGTDGVLIGAWSELEKGDRILDIGAGTGLISLMLAQRFNKAEIEAVELDKDAFLQAKQNIDSSKFRDQIKIYHQDIKNFQPDYKYDLIVSNPPFFTINKEVESDARKIARQQEALTYVELIETVRNLLSKSGNFSLIIPYLGSDQFIEIAEQNDLYLSKILYVKGNELSPIKRVLMQFSFEKKEILEETLIIEISRNNYTEDYIKLTKDFYLKM